MALEPLGDGGQRRMVEASLELAPDSGHEGEIAMLAVPPGKPGEGAEDARVPLGAAGSVGRLESGGIEFGEGSQIASMEIAGQSRRYVAPGIVDEGDEW
jgi:hypothetical protein